MRQKLLIYCFFMLSFPLVEAQTSQGTWLVGGSAGFTNAQSNSKSGVSVLTLSVNPIVGYFIKDNLAVGTGFTYESISRQYIKIGIGPIIRYYFIQIGENANILSQVGLYSGSFNPKYGDKRTLYEVSLDLGFSYFLNENVALESVISYINTNATNYTDLSTTQARENRIGINIGFQISLGSR